MKKEAVLFLFCISVVINAEITEWNAGNNFSEWGNPVRLIQSVSNGIMRLEINGKDSSIANYNVDIDPEKYSGFELEYRAQGLPEKTSGQLFFANVSQEKFIDKQFWSFNNLNSDGQWHTLRLIASDKTIPSGVELWSKCGKIDKLRLDMVDQTPGMIEIRQIRFKQREKIKNYGFEKFFSIPENWNIRENANCAFGEPFSIIFSSRNKSKSMIESSRFELIKESSLSLNFKYLLTTNIKSYFNINITYFDIFGKKLAEKVELLNPSCNDQWQDFKTILDSPNGSAFISLSFIFSNHSNQDVSFSISDITMNPEIPYWNASWIWDKDAIQIYQKKIYFRKKIFIAAPDEIENFFMQITADDQYGIYINGTHVKSKENFATWQYIDIYDLKSLLKKGENVIAVSAFNEGGPCGLLAELMVEKKTEKGKKYDYYGTDSSWKTSDMLVDKWNEISFDDSTWKTATVICKAGQGRWGLIPYKNYLGVLGKIKIPECDIPETIEGDKTYEIRPSFIFENSVLSNTSTRFEVLLLGKDNVLSINIFNKEITLDKSKNSGDLSLSLNFRFIPEGSYFLRIYADGMVIENHPKGFISVSGKNYIEKEIKVIQPIKREIPNVTIKKLDSTPILSINNNKYTTNHFEIAPLKGKIFSDEIRLLDNMTKDSTVTYWMWIDDWKWIGEGNYDFTKLDNHFAGFFSQHPESYLMLELCLDISGSFHSSPMLNWYKSGKYEKEFACEESGNTKIQSYQQFHECASFASKIWLEELSLVITNLISHIKKSPYADRVIGIVPCVGVSAEWMYWGSQAEQFLDYSIPFTDAFRNWVKSKYHNDITELNKHWNARFRSFEDVNIPSKKERIEKQYKGFLISSDQNIIDLQMFFSEIITDDIIYLCKTVKDVSEGRMLTGAYYGYNMYVVKPYWFAHTGHFAMEKILSSPYIDILMSPSRYQDREIGGGIWIHDRRILGKTS